MRHDDYYGNLLRWWEAATAEEVMAGLVWYDTARREAQAIADRTGLSLDTVAGVIAALSPQNRWHNNLTDASAYCEAAAAGRPQPKAATFRHNQNKGWRIANGENWRDVLKGPKVRAFAANITGDHDPVTVDLWSSRAATMFALTKVGRKYDAVAEAHRRLAAQVNLPPAHVQAVIWTVARSRGMEALRV